MVGNGRQPKFMNAHSTGCKYTKMKLDGRLSFNLLLRRELEDRREDVRQRFWFGIRIADPDRMAPVYQQMRQTDPGTRFGATDSLAHSDRHLAVCLKNAAWKPRSPWLAGYNVLTMPTVQENGPIRGQRNPQSTMLASVLVELAFPTSISGHFRDLASKARVALHVLADAGEVARHR